MYFVKKIKTVSSGSNSCPQNTKSGAAMVKCMDIQGLMAQKKKKLGSNGIKSNKIYLPDRNTAPLPNSVAACLVTELDPELEITEIILRLMLGSLFPCVFVPGGL